MALPPEKVRAYRPLLDVLVEELLREFEQEREQSDADLSDSQAKTRPRRSATMVERRETDAAGHDP